VFSLGTEVALSEDRLLDACCMVEQMQVLPTVADVAELGTDEVDRDWILICMEQKIKPHPQMGAHML